MSSLPARQMKRWYQPAFGKERVVFMSDVDWWYCHFVSGERRSRRCGAAECALCRDGMAPSLRFVVLIARSNGELCWLELRERHRRFLEEAQFDGDSLVGAAFYIGREDVGTKSPVTLRYDGRDDIIPHDISRFVAALGGSPVLISH